MRSRTPLLRALSLLGAGALALSLAACGSDGGSADAESSPEKTEKITIGAFNFPESELMANIYAQLLEKRGYEATVKSLGAREVVEPALEKGEIQLVPEYLGTFATFLNTKINGQDAEPVASGDLEETLKNAKELAAQRGLKVLEPAEAQNQNAFAVTRDFAEANNLKTISDLAKVTTPLTLGGPPECPQRPFCQPGLEETYGLTFDDFTAYQKFPLIKQALKNGDIQVGLVFSSDAGNQVNDLVVLEDDKGLQAVDNLTPVVLAKADAEGLESALASINSELTTEVLIGLNNRIENQRQTPANVAKDWLTEQGLI